MATDRNHRPAVRNCARCPTGKASFRVGPPLRTDEIWLCGPCFFSDEGADLKMAFLRRMNDE
jgi:hypothetical protein